MREVMGVVIGMRMMMVAKTTSSSYELSWSLVLNFIELCVIFAVFVFIAGHVFYENTRVVHFSLCSPIFMKAYRIVPLYILKMLIKYWLHILTSSLRAFGSKL